MGQFGIQTLLFGTFVAACLVAFSLNSNQPMFFVVSLALPVVVGLYFHCAVGSRRAHSLVATFATAVATGAVLMAIGSYTRTFIEQSQGILVGDGWNSVFASFLFGGLVGSVFGLFALVIYFVLASIIDLWLAQNTT